MTLEGQLTHLTAVSLLRLRRPEPELEYLFRHALIQEAAYTSLLKNDRRLLHKTVADVLQTLYPQQVADLAPVLAHHYRLAEDEVGERQNLRLAAEQATARFGNREAVDYFVRLLELTPPTDSARVALTLQLGEARCRLGDFPAARAAIEHAQAAAQTDADRTAALALLGEVTSEMGHYAEAQTFLTQAIPLARASGDELTLCRALYALGDVNWRMRKMEAAEAALNESLALARALGDVTRELFALNRLGTVSLHVDLAKAEGLYQEVYVRAAAVGNRERMAVALNNLGTVAGMRDDLALSTDYARQSLALAREIGAEQNIAISLINLADGEVELGQLAVARTLVREGLALALRQGALPLTMAALRVFAFIAHAEGQTERALAIWGLAYHHPAWSSEAQRNMDITLATWGLDPAVVEAGLAKGAELDWDETIGTLLKG